MLTERQARAICEALRYDPDLIAAVPGWIAKNDPAMSRRIPAWRLVQRAAEEAEEG